MPLLLADASLHEMRAQVRAQGEGAERKAPCMACPIARLLPAQTCQAGSERQASPAQWGRCTWCLPQAEHAHIVHCCARDGRPVSRR